MGKKRNIGLDIARVCAMVLVWINHSGFFDLGLDPRFMEYGGVACIEVFFVLSGFLVGGRMLRAVTSEQPGKKLKEFYVNRLLRTLPLYYLVLVGLGVLRGQRPSVLNFLFLHGFNENALGFLPPAWSLPIEAWFYFLIPPVLLLLYRLFSRKQEERKAVYLSVAVIALVPFLLRCAHVLLNDPVWDYGVRKQVPVRMDSPMLGVFLAAVKLYAPKKYRTLGKSLLTLLASAVGFVAMYLWFVPTLRENIGNPDGIRIFLFSLLPVFSGLLIAWLENADWLEIFRGTVIETLICTVSSLGYSSFLLHYPIFVWISEYFIGASFYYSWAGFGLAIGVTLVLSWLSWRFIEEPIAKLKDKIPV